MRKGAVVKGKERGKQKCPSAQKRVTTSEKRRLINSSFKSKVKTTIKKYEIDLKEGDASSSQDNLKLVYSVLDRAVKRGIFKINKASRLKSRLSLKGQRV